VERIRGFLLDGTSLFQVEEDRCQYRHIRSQAHHCRSTRQLPIIAITAIALAAALPAVAAGQSARPGGATHARISRRVGELRRTK
jgi:hypothetical protein